MAKYLLIESRDPFEGRDVVKDYDLAASLVKAGNDVTLFLVQNGVLPARPSAFSERLSQLAKEKVEVLAESFSLAERGIKDNDLVEWSASTANLAPRKALLFSTSSGVVHNPG